jgi:hypothetical protein
MPWVPVQYLTIESGKGIFNMAEKVDGTRGWVPLRNLVEEDEWGK